MRVDQLKDAQQVVDQIARLERMLAGGVGSICISFADPRPNYRATDRVHRAGELFDHMAPLITAHYRCELDRLRRRAAQLGLTLDKPSGQQGS